jgi:hypothetical protein
MRKFLFILLIALTSSLYGQKFEEAKDNGEGFDKPSVKVGGDFAIQFQSLSHEADSVELISLGKGFNLPTANLNIDATLAKGVKLNLVTYLSARHHNEAWVKGGYLIMDQLPFLNSTAVDNIMHFFTIKAGVMEINYGDAHFRRSDNGNVINNPFVGNYIVDAFTTAPALELMFRKNGIIAMAAVSSGSLRPDLAAYKASDSTYTAYNTKDELAYYGKIGYDNILANDLRLRLTLSGYYCAEHHFGSLYNGDRAGSRYYLIMNTRKFAATDVDIKSNHTSGNWSPGLTSKDMSLMANAFASFKGLEVFGTYENASTKSPAGVEYNFNQLAFEALYNFGSNKQFFGGARYNIVDANIKRTNNIGESVETNQTISRIQLGAGWHLLASTVVKLEYVMQNYDNFNESDGEGEFSGVMFEAAISF